MGQAFVAGLIFGTVFGLAVLAAAVPAILIAAAVRAFI